MSRRSADGADRAPLRMVRPSGPAVKRARYVPVADLLAREGQPLETDDDFLVADAVASVRRGMAGIAIGLLAIVGAGTILDNSMVDDASDIAEHQGSPPASTPSTVDATSEAREPTKVKRVAQPAQRTVTARMRSERSGSGSSGSSGTRSGGGYRAPQTQAPAPQPAPSDSGSSTNWQDYSGNYGQDYSGNYGRDYYDWGG